jgi:triphosphatase
MKEIELRFQIPPSQWAAVHRWVNGEEDAPGAGAHRERLRASYFDTPTRDLARAGFALRLRLEGDTWVQTLKGAAPDGMTRLEHNVPVAGDTPVLDLGRHADHPAGQALQVLLDRLGSPTLQALFRTDIERLSRAFSTPFGDVELALDQGALLAGELPEERRTPVAELEIELKQGDPRAVLEVAREWALHRFGLTLELRTKALRGDLLARGESAAPAQASGPASWRAGQTQAQALTTLLQSVVEPLLGNASQIITGIHQPEHLHQLRVALRRLRVGADLLVAAVQTDRSGAAPHGEADHAAVGGPGAAVEPVVVTVTDEDLLALRSLGEGARQLGRLLTAARDADAQALAGWRRDLERAWQQAPMPTRPDATPVLPAAVAGPTPGQLLAEPLWQDWMLSIVAWLVRGWPSQAPAEAVLSVVEQMGDKALHLARRFDKLDVEGRHHLRRRLRRWKMALEMTAQLQGGGREGEARSAAPHSGKGHKSSKAQAARVELPRRVARQLARVQEVQKPLGELNDLEVGLAQARASLVRAVAAGAAGEAARAAFELGWLTPLRNEALTRMRRRVKRLKR